ETLRSTLRVTNDRNTGRLASLRGVADGTLGAKALTPGQVAFQSRFVAASRPLSRSRGLRRWLGCAQSWAKRLRAPSAGSRRDDGLAVRPREERRHRRQQPG